VGDPSYLELPLREFLERLSADTPAPGGGSAAALTVTFAASLVTMVARHSRSNWPDAGSVAAQARKLQARCSPLAQQDAEAWVEALEALHRDGTESRPRDADLEGKLARAAEVPLWIAEVGADVAVLAALTAERGEGTYRGDAAAAAVLAHAGARAAANLVALNLGMREHDVRLGQARRSEEAAAAAAARALDAGP
jgi:glutamate formiminotransferase/formiminotetrahydrofolate cyclodeaminase